MTNKIQEQDNKFFSIVYNKELDCFDLTMKQAKYDTSTDLLGILAWLHQLGINCPQEKLRIGARIEEASNIVVNKPKIII